MTYSKSLKLSVLLIILMIWTACSDEEAEPLTISAQDFSIEINENPSLNALIGTLDVVTNKSADLSYTLKNQSVENALLLNAEGQLRVADPMVFDFETNSNIRAEFIVSSGQVKDSASINITLLDIDELEIELSDFNGSIEENPISGTVIGTVDAQTNNGLALNFSILEQSVPDAIEIDEQGQLKVLDSAAFDFEIHQELTAIYEASAEGISETAQVLINIIDLADAVQAMDFSVDINENPSQGQLLGQLNASTSNGGSLSFMLVDQSVSNAFSLDASTGDLVVNDPNAFDYEENQSLNATYRAVDGQFADTATITVNILDVNESITANDFESDIVENPQNGDVIGTLDATHSQNGTALTFSLSNQSEAGAIALGDASTGQIVVSNAAVFDYEINQQITADYQVTDGSTTETGQITITILNDEADDISVSANEFTTNIDENPNLGLILGTVDAQAVNTTNPIVYSLQDNGAGAFAIDASTGEVSIADVSFFDYEVNTQVRGVYKAVVNDTISATAYIVVNVVNVGEIIASDFSASIDENPQTGDIIGAVSATIDNGNSVQFSLSTQSVAGALAIDQSSGELSVDDASAFDYETNQSLTATFEVVDPTNPNSAVNASITVSINDLGGSWTTVGQAGLTGTAKQIELVINNGQPIFTYNDYTNVKAVAYTAGSWQFLGSNITGNVAGNTDLVSHDNEVYIAYTDPVNSDRATVKKYLNGSWTALGGNGFSSGTAAYIHLAFSNGNTPWVIYKEGGTTGTKARNYDANLQLWNNITGTTGGIVNGNTYGTDIAFDPVANHAYVAYSLNGNGGGNNVQVSYYANIGGNPRWRTYGNLSGGSTAQNIIEIDENGAIYVLYKHTDNKIYIERRLNLNDSWTVLGGGAASPTVTEYDMVLVDGLPYLIYVDASTFNLSMKRWNGSIWVDESIDFETGANPNLAIDTSTGEVYVAFGDSDHSQGVTVLKWQAE